MDSKKARSRLEETQLFFYSKFMEKNCCSVCKKWHRLSRSRQQEKPGDLPPGWWCTCWVYRRSHSGSWKWELVTASGPLLWYEVRALPKKLNVVTGPRKDRKETGNEWASGWVLLRHWWPDPARQRSKGSVDAIKVVSEWCPFIYKKKRETMSSFFILSFWWFNFTFWGPPSGRFPWALFSPFQIRPT